MGMIMDVDTRTTIDQPDDHGDVVAALKQTIEQLLARVVELEQPGLLGGRPVIPLVTAEAPANVACWREAAFDRDRSNFGCSA
ncbi:MULTISPECIES: hypothetical protein [Bradyrhizobium]|uniref:Uncharacterized protein n=2 Tax=Bradyrhizobium japonicum TaxID=375 RepID=A0A0A3XFA1_BRAJP|nr:hypothetical protein [Bradyrhizobium japonicum]AJA61623.1 hypothetical protein RN69_15585 [Bradyrhizobium japonicum]AJA64867.1 hypothetical protein RN69_34585 [Bradyrhizobium japonicum]KGT72960.1 hypothetical protein MA20_47165 [Bradyrhizobium japonicum]MBR0916433.1 hypothetical protein [Bradyrhizobium japonicum]MCS3533206.1 hypothetical protein [Bradyrhizobium japonicum]